MNGFAQLLDRYRAPALWRGLVFASCALLGAGVAQASLCESGKRQSPVDITMSTRQKLPPLSFDYRPAPLKLADDGHTVRVRFANASQLHIGKERFVLQQFHFHTPGGDRIAGEEFPMAAHLLHKNAAGQLLAVVVLFRVGAENPVFTQLLPLIPAKADGDHAHPAVQVNALKLLPEKRAYFRYSGSLTAPPCTEGFDWIVLKEPMHISAAQLAVYRKRFADNARAVQPLHNRVVLESF
jgi:carbonic anhydrase